jgi:predicted MFS family arabinose efflux permease
VGGVLTTERRLAIRLESLTVGWNAIEAVVAIAAGAAAGSVALVGFGLDSVVEVSAALVVLWQFFGIAEERERRALRLIGGSFFALAA